MDLVKNIDNLSIAEKISLYNCLYEDLAGKGTEGDTELAHVNKDEMAVLRSMGGSGTINPETNLIQFGGSKSSPPPPTTQTVKQQSTFPEELQPFIKDIFGKGQAIQEKREEDGYTPFTGPRLADFTPDQQAAFEGIRGLVGASEPYFDRSQELVESSAVAPTSESIGTLMNPYIQNVIDVEKREASRQSDISGQNLAGKAAISNAFGGSREAILRAELERNTQQQLGDIQTRGTAAAFEDAQRRFAEQKARESGAASNFMNLGTTAPAAARSELSALEAIGATQQGRSQQGLDIAQQEFEIERTFPERTLQDYSSILRGFTQPLPASTFRQSSTQAPGASFGQTASGIAGLGLTAANLFKPQDGFKFGTASAGGLVGLANGGMVAKYQAGKTIGNTTPNDTLLKRMGLTKEMWENNLNDEGREKYLKSFPPIPEGDSPLSRTFTSLGDYMDRSNIPQQLSRGAIQKADTSQGDKIIEYLTGTPESFAKANTEQNAYIQKAEQLRGAVGEAPIPVSEPEIAPAITAGLTSNPPVQPTADADPYGLKAYMAAKTKYSEGKTKALDDRIGQEQGKKIQVFADKLLAYAGAKPGTEFQKIGESFEGINKELADIEQGSYAAEVAKSSLDLEDEKENLELRMKLKDIQIKASKAGLMSAKDLASLSEFAVSNQAGAEKVRDNPKTDRLTKRILTDLLSVLPKSNLGTGNGNRTTGPTTPAKNLTRVIGGEKVKQ